MSIESAPNRADEIRKANDLITENDLLSRDEFTRQMAESGFKVDGQEVDPGNWIADRLEELESQEKNAPVTSKLSKKVLKDFEQRKGD